MLRASGAEKYTHIYTSSSHLLSPLSWNLQQIVRLCHKIMLYKMELHWENRDIFCLLTVFSLSVAASLIEIHTGCFYSNRILMCLFRDSLFLTIKSSAQLLSLNCFPPLGVIGFQGFPCICPRTWAGYIPVSHPVIAGKGSKAQCHHD